MNTKIVRLSELELSEVGKFNSEFSEVIVNNCIFIKGPNFSLSLEEQVLNYCQKLANNSQKTLIIKGKYSYTVWVEQKSSNDLSSTIISPSEPIDNSLTNDRQQPLIKKIIKKYRAQIYEEIVSQPVISSTIPEKHRRKYRGQYID
jgi:hypothetical protein